MQYHTGIYYLLFLVISEMYRCISKKLIKLFKIQTLYQNITINRYKHLFQTSVDSIPVRLSKKHWSSNLSNSLGLPTTPGAGLHSLPTSTVSRLERILSFWGSGLFSGIYKIVFCIFLQARKEQGEIPTKLFELICLSPRPNKSMVFFPLWPDCRRILVENVERVRGDEGSYPKSMNSKVP